MPVDLLTAELARLGPRHLPAILRDGILGTILYFTPIRDTDLSHATSSCHHDHPAQRVHSSRLSNPQNARHAQRLSRAVPIRDTLLR